MTITVKQAIALGLEQSLDRVDVDALLCAVLGKDRSFLFAWPEQTLTEQQQSVYREYLNQRSRGKPIAYITGIREFWSLPIKTHPSTLIPRPDTEVLVETALEFFDAEPKCCIDLGTGTGAIALALKSERPAWQIYAVDRIPEAVQLAKENALSLRLTIMCQQGNWLSDFEVQTADVIVTNPPYIDSEDEHLQQGDVQFEPASALISADHGLADIIAIAQSSFKVLKSGGGLFLEHGWQQATQVQSILTRAGFIQVDTRKDYGGNDRVTFGFKP